MENITNDFIDITLIIDKKHHNKIAAIVKWDYVEASWNSYHLSYYFQKKSSQDKRIGNKQRRLMLHDNGK